MRAYADTSFLFALMLQDTNSAAAAAYLRTHRQPLLFGPLQRCELRNALRLAVFRGRAAPAAAKDALAQIERGLESGNLVDVPLAWTEALHEADRVGEKYTATLGVRTMDLLHVGAALSLGANEFLTFDARQYACAKAAGRRGGP